MRVSPNCQTLIVPPFECAWLHGSCLQLPDDGSGCIAFEARAENDVTVVLREAAGGPHYRYDVSSNYTVVVGSHGNRQVRIAVDGQTVAAAADKSTLRKDMFESIWVNVTEGKIAVGRGYPGQQLLLLARVDENPNRAVRFVGLSSWDKHVEYRNIRVLPALDGIQDFESDDCGWSTTHNSIHQHSFNFLLRLVDSHLLSDLTILSGTSREPIAAHLAIVAPACSRILEYVVEWGSEGVADGEMTEEVGNGMSLFERGTAEVVDLSDAGRVHETKRTIVWLPNFGKEAILMLLKFIYTGKLPPQQIPGLSLHDLAAALGCPLHFAPTSLPLDNELQPWQSGAVPSPPAVPNPSPALSRIASSAAPSSSSFQPLEMQQRGGKLLQLLAAGRYADAIIIAGGDDDAKVSKDTADGRVCEGKNEAGQHQEDEIPSFCTATSGCSTIATSRAESGSAASTSDMALFENDGSYCSASSHPHLQSTSQRCFRVHRCVLAASSPIFFAMLTNGMQESSTAELLLREASPAALRLLLHFAYSSCLPLDQVGREGKQQENEGGGTHNGRRESRLDLVRLLVDAILLADQFCMLSFVAVTSGKLQQMIDEHTALPLLSSLSLLPSTSASLTLRNACVAFSAAHLPQCVAAAPGHLSQLSQDTMMLIMQHPLLPAACKSRLLSALLSSASYSTPHTNWSPSSAEMSRESTEDSTLTQAEDPLSGSSCQRADLLQGLLKKGPNQLTGSSLTAAGREESKEVKCCKGHWAATEGAGMRREERRGAETCGERLQGEEERAEGSGMGVRGTEAEEVDFCGTGCSDSRGGGEGESKEQGEEEEMAERIRRWGYIGNDVEDGSGDDSGDNDGSNDGEDNKDKATQEKGPEGEGFEWPHDEQAVSLEQMADEFRHFLMTASLSDTKKDLLKRWLFCGFFQIDDEQRVVYSQLHASLPAKLPSPCQPPCHSSGSQGPVHDASHRSQSPATCQSSHGLSQTLSFSPRSSPCLLSRSSQEQQPSGSLLPIPTLNLTTAFLHELQFVRDGDQNGVCYLAGTSFGQHPWMNPVTLGTITVTASSPPSRYTDPKVIVSRSFASSSFAGPPSLDVQPKPTCHCLTRRARHSSSCSGGKLGGSSGVLSWWQIDLGETTRLNCNYYSVRQDGSNHFMRSWVLEASNDLLTWQVLRRHDADHTLAAAGQFASWAVAPQPEEQQQMFRVFRIRLTAPSSTGSHSMCLCYIELYGYLFHT